MTVDDLRQLAQDYVAPVAVRLAIVALLLASGRTITRALLRALDRLLERHKADPSLRKFVGDVAQVVMTGAVVVIALDTVGIKTTAVVAVLGAAGLAIGLALQGSLSNFAAGMMLMVLRPYRVGDAVLLGKYVGKVDAIKVFHTVVVTADNRQITIPNGQILAQPIENHTALGRRRIDLAVTVAEVADLDALKRTLAELAAGDGRVDEAAAEVAEVNETGARLVVRAWTRAEVSGDVAIAQLERLRAALRGATPRFTVAIAAPA